MHRLRLSAFIVACASSGSLGFISLNPMLPPQQREQRRRPASVLLMSERKSLSELKQEAAVIDKDNREIEIRAKIDAIKRMKQQGLSYNGKAPSSKSKPSNIDAVEESLMQGQMAAAERFMETKTASKGAEEDLAADPTSRARAAASDSGERGAVVEVDFSSPEGGSSADVFLKEEMTTSGIGGAWRKSGAEVETHKPSTSGSWGVFERPSTQSSVCGILVASIFTPRMLARAPLNRRHFER